MYTIMPLTEISFDALYAAWENAFRDYDRTWTRKELKAMFRRRGYIPALSFGAFDNERLISFTINSIDIFDGVKTAYDTGTGTVKEYRGQGLASEIFKMAIPVLKQEGIERYILEVLQHNTTAVSIYKKTGFTINREFNYFIKSADAIQANDKILPSGIELRGMDMLHEHKMTAMWDFAPSWQNSFGSILRAFEDFKIIGAYSNDDLVGYGITDPASGDITQIAVDKQYRRRGIGSCIFKKLLSYNTHTSAKVINTDKSLSHITTFIEHNGIPYAGSQFEMILNI